MQFLQIFIVSVTATSVMTTFSYVMATIKKSQFEEPEILNKLIDSDENIPLHISKNNILGWFIHYFLGFAFVAIFYFCWSILNIAPTLLSGLLLGAGAGIIGIGGWRILFYLNSNPPDIYPWKFFLQLLIAHIIFGIIATYIYLQF